MGENALIDVQEQKHESLGYHYMSAERRWCLFHTIVFLLNGREHLVPPNTSGATPSRPWTVDTLMNFFFYDVLPWVELAAPHLLAALLGRGGHESIDEYQCARPIEFSSHSFIHADVEASASYP